jgi:hypothetical protein
MRLTLPFLLVIGIVPIAAAQANPPVPPLRFGVPTQIWESPDGNGGAFGIEIETIESGGYPPSYAGATTYYSIGVYYRSGESVQCGEENFFTTGPLSKHFTTYSDTKLQIHYLHTVDKDPFDRDIDLDLTRDPATNIWSGTFHRSPLNTTVHLVLTSRRTNNGGCIFAGG